LRIRGARETVRLLHPKDYNYYELLRSKLNWGRTNRFGRSSSARSDSLCIMLSLIRVKNYAIIDEVELELGPGLSVVTGETGAGKSILVDALGLALGDRADASAVRHGAERAEISVLFECPPGHPALAWLAELGLDDGDVCSLRRIIGNEGRSRAFINNQPVTLQDLRGSARCSSTFTASTRISRC
jgi:recombinational DNA repair ATPase RecF